MDTASENRGGRRVSGAFWSFRVAASCLQTGQAGQARRAGRSIVLLALIEAGAARVITKDALMTRRFGPDRIVEENALQSQMSALRMALGADRDLVRTVTGAGVSVLSARFVRCRAPRRMPAQMLSRTKPASVCSDDEPARAAFPN